jgi:hypothetical protein
MLEIDGRTISRGNWEPGCWSEHLKPIAETDSCQVSHLIYVISWRMKVMMDHGSEGEIGPGAVAKVGPGHGRRGGGR